MAERWNGRKSVSSLQPSEGAEKKVELIPVYVVDGFLDAGKTSLLNRLLRRRKFKEADLLLLQFEHGEEEISISSKRSGFLELIRIPIKELQSDAEKVAAKLRDYLISHRIDQIWVEWNGMVPFTQLQKLLLSVSGEREDLSEFRCQIQKVLHLADAETVEEFVARTGGVLLEQIANSDMVVLRNVESKAQFRQLKRRMRTWNPGVKVLPMKPLRAVEQAVKRPNPPQIPLFVVGVVCFVVLYLLLRITLGHFDVSLNRVDAWINVFLGIVLQAIPFLLVGVLLSSAIQIFVPQQFIERWFPKHPAGGMLFAVLAGFCLPVCDCASIPVFRSLVRKGVPMAAAVTFMAATPIINPVAILSTWYAFNGNAAIVVCRIGLGILCAVLIGLTFTGKNLKRETMVSGVSGVYCTCGCYNDTVPDGWSGKMLLYLRHAKAEFFDVGRYLLFGAFVSALFQVLGGNLTWAKGQNGLLLPLILMMAMAFLLSLCSSSDAIVARSFASQFPTGALMGFLVFGPMMDIKNLILLSGSCSKRFIIRLTLTMFLVCASVVYLAFCLGMERVLV